MTIYIGSARVLATEDDGRPRVQILGGHCQTLVADWAIPFHYAPRAHDIVQVYGQHDRYWVTGILRGAGTSQLAFRGDTTLHATDAMHLDSDGGTRLDAPQIGLHAQELASESEHLTQRIDALDSEVRGTVDERAGECARVIDGDDEQIAARHSTVAKHAVKIDGSLLRLS